MSKHYTPTIEEFHVGFEYEQAFTVPRGIEFESVVCGKDQNQYLDLESIYRRIERETVRVKYLDVEDIKSLGWRQFPDGRLTFNYELHDYMDYQMKFQIENQFAIIFGSTFPAEIFQGIIKNKSEFKRLMKQLMIIE